MRPSGGRWRGSPKAHGRGTGGARARQGGLVVPMPYHYYSRVLCPLCEGGEMRAVNASLARCSRCDETMDHDLYEALLAIRALPETGDAQAPTSADRRGRGRGGGH